MDEWNRLHANIDSEVRAETLDEAYPEYASQWELVGPESFTYPGAEGSWQWSCTRLVRPPLDDLPLVDSTWWDSFKPSKPTEPVGGSASTGEASFTANTIPTDIAPPQPNGQDGGSDDESGGECSGHISSSALVISPDLLPFPRDRDQLFNYLARGLPLTRLFPVTGSAALRNLVCKGQLELTGDRWTVMERECHKQYGSLTSLRRHVKQDHLHMSANGASIKEIIACWETSPHFKDGRPAKCLRIMPWDRLVHPFLPTPPQPASAQTPIPTTPIATTISPSSASPMPRKRWGSKTMDLKTASREGKSHGKRTGRA